MPERFWEKVAETPGCWLWTAARDDKGYGRFAAIPGSSQYAHRVAWQLTKREDIPAGLHLDHLCRNPPCVNPAHLEPVTSEVNTNRSPLARSRRTHCPQGHAYEGDNLYLYTDKRGYEHRYCRTCQNAAARAWREARAS